MARPKKLPTKVTRIRREDFAEVERIARNLKISVPDAFHLMIKRRKR